MPAALGAAYGIERELGGGGMSREAIAAIYAALGERNNAFRRLDKAYRDRSAGLVRLESPTAIDRFSILREDPRFPMLVRRVGLR